MVGMTNIMIKRVKVEAKVYKEKAVKPIYNEKVVKNSYEKAVKPSYEKTAKLNFNNSVKTRNTAPAIPSKPKWTVPGTLFVSNLP